VRGRLWRASNPALPESERQRLVTELMAARRAVRDARGDDEATRAARARVQAAKVALGERGPAWWTDGAPDCNRRMAANTPYADWAAAFD
jgi:hypothetical protein